MQHIFHVSIFSQVMQSNKKYIAGSISNEPLNVENVFCDGNTFAPSGKKKSEDRYLTVDFTMSTKSNSIYLCFRTSQVSIYVTV